jgi:hypothetical protein
MGEGTRVSRGCQVAREEVSLLWNRRKSINGEDPRIVNQKRALLSLRCARAPSSLWVVGERAIPPWQNTNELIFRNLDLVNDENRELAKTQINLPLGEEN